MSYPSYKISSNSTAKFAIPPGWFTIVSAVFRKDGKQAMLIRFSIKSGSALFQSDAIQPESAHLLNQLEGSASFPIAPKNRPVHVELSFYHPEVDLLGSKAKRAAGEHHKLIPPEYLVRHVTVVDSTKPARLANLKDIPDYVTYNVFVQDTATPSIAQVPAQEQLASAVAIVHVVRMGHRPDPAHAASIVSSVLPPIPDDSEELWSRPSMNDRTVFTGIQILNNPAPPPPPANIVQGYNKTLDAPRPVVMDKYLEQYDTVFLVDDSGSMSFRRRWEEACAALQSILDRAIDKNADGISLYFFNSSEFINTKGRKITKSDVRSVLNRVKPSNGTPIGERISEHLGHRLDLLDKAAGKKAEYGRIKPLDLVVLTDGEPPQLTQSDPFELKNVLINAAARKKKHHANAISVRFVQVGEDPRLRPAMEALVRLNTDGMVDTVFYEGEGSLTPEKMDRILVGGKHPNMRT